MTGLNNFPQILGGCWSVSVMFSPLFRNKREEVFKSGAFLASNKKKSRKKSENLIEAIYFCEQQLGGHLFSFIPPGKSAVGDAVKSLTNSSG